MSNFKGLWLNLTARSLSGHLSGKRSCWQGFSTLPPAIFIPEQRSLIPGERGHGVGSKAASGEVKFGQLWGC